MATIGIDATYLVDEMRYGISRYSRRLIESLWDLPSAHRFVACYRLSRLFRRGECVRPPPEKGERRFFQPPWGWRLKSKLDLFHSLAQRPPPFRFRREVVTVHDVFPLTGKDYSTPGFQQAFSPLLREAVERATRIITPSAYTAGELERHLKVSREKVRVVPEGVDTNFLPLPEEEKLAVRKRLLGREGEGKLLLHVGAIQTRKNLINCLRALSLLPAECRLVLVGGEGHGSEQVHRYIREKGISARVRVLGYVDEAELGALYEAADLLLFPSLEEGFGLPVLEAMSHSLPVVTSNTSALPEVGGDAALYVNPQDPEEIARKTSEVIENKTLRENLVSRGRARAREFSWRRTAEATLAVYEEVLSQ